MEINVCIPTLNRYDLLVECLESAKKGTVQPTHFYIMDNGGRLNHKQLDDLDIPYTLFKAQRNIGVAASWNYFINKVPEMRIICNDDILFGPRSIERLNYHYDENYLLTAMPGGANIFSCFVLPDDVIKKVGEFDERISPGYGYFEDNDYHHRMQLLGVPTYAVDEEITHTGSSTLKGYTHQQMERHHQLFRIARANYIRKWGGLPDYEVFPKPFNRG